MPELFYPKWLEPIAPDLQDLVNRYFRPVHHHEDMLILVDLLRNTAGGQVSAALLPVIRLKVGDGDLRLVRQQLREQAEFQIQDRLFCLVQLHAAVGQPCGLPERRLVAGEGSLSEIKSYQEKNFVRLISIAIELKIHDNSYLSR